MAGNIWIGTDLHLYSEDNDSRHPFRTRHYLGKLADNFAQDIQEDDLYIFLGDLCDPSVSDPKKIESIVRAIPCHKIMCRGNHDTQDNSFYREAGFDEICDILRIHNMIFSHKPVKVAPDEINIHGHLHTAKLASIGYQHINAYAANWNDGDKPVLLDDLLKAATVQEFDVTSREQNHLDTKFAEYTSYECDHYTDILDASDAFNVEALDEYALLKKQPDVLLNKICEFNTSLDVFVYGLAINGVIDKKRNTSYRDWDKYYRVASPDQFVRQRGGQCWDYVTYEASMFEKEFKGVKYDTYYVMFNVAPDYPTHTFLIFHHKGKHYLFEKAFAKLAGVIKADTVDDLISCELTLLMSNTYMHDYPTMLKSSRYVCKYNALDPNLPGMNCVEFMNYMAENGKEVNYKFIELYKVSVIHPQPMFLFGETADTLDEVIFDTPKDAEMWLADDEHWQRKRQHAEATSKEKAVVDIDENVKHVTTPYYVVHHEDMHDELWTMGNYLAATVEEAAEAYKFDLLKHGKSYEPGAALYVHRTEPGYYEVRLSDELGGCYWSTSNLTLERIGTGEFDGEGNFSWYEDSNLAEAAIKVPETLYHGSNLKLDTIAANSAYNLPSKAVKQGTPVAYGTPSYEFALCYAGRKWSDFEINQSVVNGTVVLTEIMPGAFKEFFDCKGYLYTFSGKEFIPIDKHSEFVATHDIQPDKVEEIPNVLKALRASSAVLNEYPKLPKWIPDRALYLKTLCDRYGRDYQTVASIFRSKGVPLRGVNLAPNGRQCDGDKTREQLKQELLEYIDETAGVVKRDTFEGFPRLWYASYNDLKFIVDRIPKEDHHYFYSGPVFKDSPWAVYRNAILIKNRGKDQPIETTGGAFIDVYYQSGRPANEAGVVIAASPCARGKGLTDQLVKKALEETPDNITMFTWKCEKANTHSLNLALRCGFVLDKEKSRKSKTDNFLTYTRMKTPTNESYTGDIAQTHSIDRTQKRSTAEKYGLRNVGATHEEDPDLSPEAERRRKLDEKKKHRDKNLKKARKVLKRKRFIKKVKSHLPGVKNEDADAVDGSAAEYIDDLDKDTDNQGRKVRNPYRSPEQMEEALSEMASEYKFEMLDKVYFTDRLDESASDDKLYPVYVVLMHTGTPMSKLIKGATNCEFSHASIAFDPELKSMYSFGDKSNGKYTDNGFKKESLTDSFFKNRPIHYGIYVVPCTKSEFDRMKKRLDYFISNSTKFKFDVPGCIKNFFGIADNPEYAWFCSRFVADILNAGTPNKPLIDEPSLTKPEDFKSMSFATFVTGGENFKDYNPKRVKALTDTILREKKLQKLHESAVLDICRDNPWERYVLSYQLTKLDENALDLFLQYLQSFKVRFDNHGNILITRREYDQLDQHFRSSLKMIKACEDAGNIEGVKHELYKIHYMTELIDKYYVHPDAKNLRSNAKDVRKDMMDLRSVMLNAFKQHLSWVTQREPRYNFASNYNVSDYGNAVQIPQKVLTNIGTSIVTALK